MVFDEIDCAFLYVIVYFFICLKVHTFFYCTTENVNEIISRCNFINVFVLEKMFTKKTAQYFKQDEILSILI